MISIGDGKFNSTYDFFFLAHQYESDCNVRLKRECLKASTSSNSTIIEGSPTVKLSQIQVPKQDSMQEPESSFTPLSEVLHGVLRDRRLVIAKLL